MDLSSVGQMVTPEQLQGWQAFTAPIPEPTETPAELRARFGLAPAKSAKGENGFWTTEGYEDEALRHAIQTKFRTGSYGIPIIDQLDSYKGSQNLTLDQLRLLNVAGTPDTAYKLTDWQAQQEAFGPLGQNYYIPSSAIVSEPPEASWIHENDLLWRPDEYSVRGLESVEGKPGLFSSLFNSRQRTTENFNEGLDERLYFAQNSNGTYRPVGAQRNTFGTLAQDKDNGLFGGASPLFRAIMGAIPGLGPFLSAGMGAANGISTGNYMAALASLGSLGLNQYTQGLSGGSSFIDNPTTQELTAAGGNGFWTPENIGSAMTQGAPASAWTAPLLSTSELVSIGGKGALRSLAGVEDAWKDALLTAGGAAGSNALTTAGFDPALSKGVAKAGVQLAKGASAKDALTSFGLSSGLRSLGSAADNFFNSGTAKLATDQVGALNGDSKMSYGPDNYDTIQYDEAGNATYGGYSPSDYADIEAAGNYGSGWDPESILAAFGNGMGEDYGTSESYFNSYNLAPAQEASSPLDFITNIFSPSGATGSPRGATPPINPSSGNSGGINFKSLGEALASMASIGKSVSSLGSAAYGMKLAGDQRKMAESVQKAADPWGASGGRSLADSQLQQLMRDPTQGMENDPAYRARIQAAQRASAKYGQDSGRMAVAGAQAGTDWYNQRLAQLGGLAGAGGAPGAGGGVAMQGIANANDLASKSLASLGYGISGGNGNDMASLIALLLRQQQAAGAPA